MKYLKTLVDMKSALTVRLFHFVKGLEDRMMH